jgi:hypothetical protein
MKNDNLFKVLQESGEGDAGGWLAGWMHVWHNWYIVRTYVNYTIYPHPAQQGKNLKINVWFYLYSQPILWRRYTWNYKRLIMCFRIYSSAISVRHRMSPRVRVAQILSFWNL